MDKKVRKAVYAGKFYPGSKTEIENTIEHLLKTEEKNMNKSLYFSEILGAVVPHAGYIYSGYQAVHFFQLLQNTDQNIETVVIVNPNHTGHGTGSFNLCKADIWETPMGQIQVDKEFSESLDIEENKIAHQLEHSGEVQLPLLQYFLKVPFKIVTITMNVQNVENAKLLAQKIYNAVQKTNRKIIVLASSDFSHYESIEISSCKDKILIEQILNFDTEGIAEKVNRHSISACGYGPSMALAEYTRMTGKDAFTMLLRYGHSGQVVPSEKVVAYASILFYSK
jgi:AmmeMemoRadiSam system protein B